MSPSFVHRVTKYDPADRDEHGHYTGPEDTLSDHGPMEAAYLAALPEEGSVELVWETGDGTIRHAVVDEDDHHRLAALTAGARAARALPFYADEDRPLLCAALPDADGVLRARW